MSDRQQLHTLSTLFRCITIASIILTFMKANLLFTACGGMHLCAVESFSTSWKHQNQAVWTGNYHQKILTGLRAIDAKYLDLFAIRAQREGRGSTSFNSHGNQLKTSNEAKIFFRS